jgi:DNA topoisomerase I
LTARRGQEEHQGCDPARGGAPRNTPTICRKCYVHPEILTSYVEGSLLLEVKAKVEAELRDDIAGLKPEEAAVLTLLQTRLSLTLEDKLRASVRAA